MNYENPTPVAVCLIEIEGHSSPQLVGLVRGIEPAYGLPALPGGYVDKGESIEQALSREAREEVGLVSTPEEWQLVASRITPQNRVLIFGILKRKVAADWVATQAIPCPREVLAVCQLSRDDELAFPLHQELAQRYFHGHLFG